MNRPMKPHIIFLHGPSSSGKSTLAHTLQASIDRPFLHISIDHLRDSGVLPQARFKSGEFNWRENRAAFFEGYHGAVTAFARAGNNLILEHILDSPGWAETLKTAFAPFDVFFVGVHCALPELIKREAARGDRPTGSAERDFKTIHRNRIYDIQLNGQNDPQTNIQLLLERWRSGERVSEFAEAAREFERHPPPTLL